MERVRKQKGNPNIHDIYGCRHSGWRIIILKKTPLYFVPGSGFQAPSGSDLVGTGHVGAHALWCTLCWFCATRPAWARFKCQCVCPPGSDRSGRGRSSNSLTRWFVSAPAQVSGWSCYVDHMVTVDWFLAAAGDFDMLLDFARVESGRAAHSVAMGVA